MGLETSEIYVIALFALAAAGAGLAFIRRSWAWRAELASLIGASLLWAGFLVIVLRSDAVGHDCSEPHHEGELPMLVVTLLWTAALALVVSRIPAAPRLAARVLPPLATVGVAATTVFVMLTFRPAC
jgi:hypothetical protein